MATSKLYMVFSYTIFGGSAPADQPIDFLSDAINCVLTTATNSISQNADTVYTDLTNETTGTAYTAKGAALGSKTIGTASLTTTADAADSVWTTSSFTAGQAHVFDDTITSPVDPLISYQDFGGNSTTVAADFVVQWNASGIFTVTVA